MGDSVLLTGSTTSPFAESFSFNLHDQNIFQEMQHLRIQAIMVFFKYISIISREN